MARSLLTLPTTRRWALLAVAAAAVGLAGRSSANAQLGLADFRIIDRDNDVTLPVWRHDGRLYVPGEAGARYSLRLTNHTEGRVLMVLSVDGVNIITGQTASYSQGGYILDPYETRDVVGWRKSETEVAAFRFASLPNSYAARTGRPGDVGVIGLAVFTEHRPSQAPDSAPPTINRRSPRAAPPDIAPPPPLPIPPTEKPMASPPAGRSVQGRDEASSMLAERDNEKLGTAHGEREWSVSRVVSFQRATPYPQRIQRVEYDTRANLIANGIVPPKTYADRRPRPFPGNPDGAGFVPDPPSGH